MRKAKAQPAKVVALPRQEPQPVGPVLDERIPGLLFDALGLVETAAASAILKTPYSVLRPAMMLGEDEKRDLTCAALAVAQKHDRFFSEHKDVFEFCIAFAAIHAAQANHVLLMAELDGPTEEKESGSESAGERACSPREALVTALFILAPLVLLALMLFFKSRRSE